MYSSHHCYGASSWSPKQCVQATMNGNFQKHVFFLLLTGLACHRAGKLMNTRSVESLHQRQSIYFFLKYLYLRFQADNKRGIHLTRCEEKRKLSKLFRMYLWSLLYQGFSKVKSLSILIFSSSLPELKVPV